MMPVLSRKRQQTITLWIVASLSLLAQQPAPHIGYVYPAGARQGAELEIIVGGQYLAGARRVYFSGTGLEAEVVGYERPLTPAEVAKLREQLQELVQKRTEAGARGPGEAVSQLDKQIAELKEKLAVSARRPASAAIAETVKLRVRVAAGAPCGRRELRLLTNAGLTNPLGFWIGQLPEYSRPPVKVVTEPGSGVPVLLRQQRDRSDNDPVEITLPAILNGQIGPASVHRYRFHARRGQRLVIEVSARELIPYISDTVPGWFQATLILRDAEGREVAFAGSYRFNPDPVLLFEVPRDGDYLLEVRDSLYRGREDFVYRIRAGELPFLADIFPLGGRASKRITVQLAGWNLPTYRLRLKPAEDSREIRVRKDGLWSNSRPFVVSRWPELSEKEPNDELIRAQRVKLPVVINGRIQASKDRDVFRFEGRAGQTIVAEVYARRAGSPLDSFLELLDSAGRPLASSDDAEDPSVALVTHHADSRLEWRLPAKGSYFVRVSDIQGKGGAEYAYRLRLSDPVPDFELRLAPASLNVRRGATAVFRVAVVRKDGFAGDVALRLKNAPEGFRLSGARVPAGTDQLRLTLTAPMAKAEEPFTLQLEGCAQIAGRQVCHDAVPAEDMMQAFAYHHLVPAEQWMVLVLGGASGLPWKPAAERPVRLQPGQTATVRLPLLSRRLAERLQLELDDPPPGVRLEEVHAERQELLLRFSLDPQTARPGLRGNLIVNAFLLPAQTAEGKAKNVRRQFAGPLPAIPFEVGAP
jgi:hypothetical protein